MIKIFIVVDVLLMIAGAVMLATGQWMIGAVLLAIGTIGVTIAPIALLMGGSKNARRLAATGIPATARIMGLTQTGTQINDQPVVIFDLVVEAPGRPTTQVRHKQIVPLIALGSIAPGRAIGVFVDPTNPQKLSIEWGSIAPNTISIDGGPAIDLGQYPGAAVAMRQLVAGLGGPGSGNVDLRSNPAAKERARQILQEHGVPGYGQGAPLAAQQPYGQPQGYGAPSVPGYGQPPAPQGPSQGQYPQYPQHPQGPPDLHKR